MPIIHRLGTTLYSSLVYGNANPDMSQFTQINSPLRNGVVCPNKIWTKPGEISKAVIPTGTQFWHSVNWENHSIMTNIPTGTYITTIFSHWEVCSGTHPWEKPISCRNKVQEPGLKATMPSRRFHLPLYQSLKAWPVN